MHIAVYSKCARVCVCGCRSERVCVCACWRLEYHVTASSFKRPQIEEQISGSMQTGKLQPVIFPQLAKKCCNNGFVF